jgi:hypothetical protein
MAPRMGEPRSPDGWAKAKDETLRQVIDFLLVVKVYDAHVVAKKAKTLNEMPLKACAGSFSVALSYDLRGPGETKSSNCPLVLLRRGAGRLAGKHVSLQLYLTLAHTRRRCYAGGVPGADILSSHR